MPWLGNYKPAPSRLPTPLPDLPSLLAGVSEQLNHLVFLNQPCDSSLASQSINLRPSLPSLSKSSPPPHLDSFHAQPPRRRIVLQGNHHDPIEGTETAYLWCPAPATGHQVPSTLYSFSCLIVSQETRSRCHEPAI